MNKTFLTSLIIGLAVILTAIFAFQAFGSTGSAKESSALNSETGIRPTTGPTIKNCYSSAYRAATDCDRLASATILIPVSGNGSNGPTKTDCYSSVYHAVTDCDRLASGDPTQ